MWKRLLIGASTLALVTAGIGIGMFVQYRLQIGVAQATARQFQNLARGLAGEGATGPAAPPLDDWRYPDAHEQGKLEGTSVEINGRQVIPPPYGARWTTSDDYDKVVAFYAGKGGFKHTNGQYFEANTQGESNIVLSDDQLPDGSVKSRPVHALCLRRRCASYDLTVFISRAETEAHTHIVLLYEPKVSEVAAQR